MGYSKTGPPAEKNVGLLAHWQPSKCPVEEVPQTSPSFLRDPEIWLPLISGYSWNENLRALLAVKVALADPCPSPPSPQGP
jgi:hypothetical protein